jgi:hypothetical protein
MAWPRIKNSRSSAQPGTQPHDGVQATVTPAPNAEPPPGSGQNTGINGTTHAVAYSSAGASSAAARNPGAQNPAPQNPGHQHPGARTSGARGGTGPGTARAGGRQRPIRYAHAGPDERADPVPVETASAAGWDDPVSDDPVSDDTVLSGVVLPGRRPPGRKAADDRTPGKPGGQAQPSGQTKPASQTKPADAARSGDQGGSGEPAPGTANEGLGIFGGVATTEATDDPPAHDRRRRPQRSEPPPAGREPGPATGAGPAWNQPVGARPGPSGGDEARKPNPFLMILGVLRGGSPVDDGEPRPSVRDLPPDVQLGLWRMRLIIMVVVGAVFAALTRSWEVALTLAILAAIVTTIYQSRNASKYARKAHSSVARKRTNRQLDRMRREGYLSLDARPIPNSREVIDHLVVGPSGIYAIDSEKWDAKLPVRAQNGMRLFLGPESQKERLQHAVWEAGKASELLTAALGTEIPVRPALAIYGPKIPWDIITIRDVDVFTGQSLRKYLKRRGRFADGVVRLTREQIHTIYETAARVLPDVTASSKSYTPVG